MRSNAGLLLTCVTCLLLMNSEDIFGIRPCGELLNSWMLSAQQKDQQLIESVGDLFSFLVKNFWTCLTRLFQYTDKIYQVYLTITGCFNHITLNCSWCEPGDKISEEGPCRKQEACEKILWKILGRCSFVLCCAAEWRAPVKKLAFLSFCPSHSSSYSPSPSTSDWTVLHISQTLHT